ncbi:MAG TPA: ATP-binding protein, partial [Gammaproteobacteria bacterium]
MTRGWRIRGQLLALALLPALLVAVPLVVLLTDARIAQLEEAAAEQLHAQAETLAYASEYALFSGDTSGLSTRGLLANLERAEEFEFGMLRDLDGRILISWGDPALRAFPAEPLPVHEQWVSLSARPSRVFHHPVLRGDRAADHPLQLSSPGAEAEAEADEVIGWISLQQSLLPLQRETAAIVRNSILITLAGVVFGGLLALRLSGRLSRRILDLANAVLELGRGELGARARVQGKGELGVLEQGVNRMAAALEQSHQQLEQEVARATADLRGSLRTLAQQETRYRELVQNAGSIIVQFDLAGTITFWNEFAEQFFGHPQEAVLGQPIESLLVQENPGFRALLDAAGPRESSLLGAHRTVEGRTVFVNWALQVNFDRQQRRTGVIAIGNDVTEQHRVYRAIGMLSEAGTEGRDPLADIARALQTGLGCRWCGIYGEPEGGDPQRLLVALDGAHPAPAELLAPALPLLERLLATGSREIRAFEVALPAAGTAPGAAATAHLRAAVALGNDGAPLGCIFGADDHPGAKGAPGDQLLRLIARRLGLELQRLRDHQLLTRARDGALAATAAKSRFLANVSHEIRTPMNGIIGFSRLLQREPLPPRQQGQVGLILQSAQSLLAVINDILDFSKIEAGKLRVNAAPVQLVELVEGLLAVLAVQAQQKGIELCHRLADELPSEVLTDGQRLQQVLTNLLGNAIKFSERGTVQLELAPERDAEGEWLRFGVTDQGIGIAADAAAGLFEPFSQVESSLSREHAGTGLGLAISRQLVELLGGSIGVDSTPGRGSRFWFRVPLRRGAASRPLRDAVGSLLAGQRVLLLEQDPTTRAASTRLLEQAGGQVETAADATELAAQSARPGYERALLVIGLGAGNPAGSACDELLPLLRPQPGQQVLLLTQVSSDALPSGRCSGCLNWCVNKPLLFATLRQPSPGRDPGRQAAATAAPLDDALQVDAIAPNIAGRWRGRRVLVADDSQVNRVLVATLLREAGIDVVQAADGDEAVESATSAPPDLVLMDLQMPRRNGIEATAELRRRLGRRCPPVVALTAHVPLGAAAELGDVDDRLLKPLDEEALWQLLERWLPPLAGP